MFRCFVKSLLKIINLLIPKNNSKMVFSSRPDYADNARTLYEYLIENNTTFRCIWTVADINLRNRLTQKGIEAYSQKSLIGLYHFMTSKFIVSTHQNYLSIKSPRQKMIELWHGMPFKAIGFLDANVYLDKEKMDRVKKHSKAIDLTVCTSPFMKNIIAGSFRVAPNKVAVTGLPRNDKLHLTDRNELAKKLEINQSIYDYIAIYAPTFRIGFGRQDGNSVCNNIFGFEDYNKDLMSNFLRKNKILLLIKLHPLEEANIDRSNLPDNSLLLTKNWIVDNFIDTYELLGGTDLLLTDYSSIFFDYLLLNRPIIFVVPDKEKYTNDRAFCLEPFDFWTPGPKVFTFENLLQELQRAILDDNFYVKERQVINSLINTYMDAENSKRVMEKILELS